MSHEVTIFEISSFDLTKKWITTGSAYYEREGG